jgi:tryptophan synthase alpha chain
LFSKITRRGTLYWIVNIAREALQQTSKPDSTIYNAFVPFHFEKKPSLIAYVTCGDPDLATTKDVILAAIDAGASVIELGVPFSDPLADGPVIQRASERALKKGVSLQHVLTLASEIREHSQSVGLVIFSYLNPILRMGLPKFCQVARLAGIDGTLITDLPVEESAEYLREARKNDLATIFLAAPTSTDQRLKAIAQVSTGFIYAISRTGVTGARAKMTGDAKSLVKRIRRFTKLPVAVGFGISTPEQFTAVGKFAEGAVVGSAIVHAIEQNPGREAATVAEFVRQLSAVSSQLSAGK